MISNVLMVCHGNVCRSPMAAALLRQRAPWLKVNSAGLIAAVGQAAAIEAAAVLSEIGLTIPAHRATQLTGQLVRDADLVLTMSVAQLQSVRSLYPVAHGRIFLIRAFDNVDVEDPMGSSVAAFRTCREALIRGVDHWAQRLEKLSRPRSIYSRSETVSIDGDEQ